MFFKANFRKAIIAIIIGMASVLPSQVFAIGLGEIQLNSSLNEPLNAEIQLLQVRGLNEADIMIGIAPKADFEAAGVDRLFFLSSLKFSLELNNPKGPLVRIKTDAPVREPYLNFLLEVQWPSGRLLREYTLLMDLPAMAAGASTARVIKGTQAPVIQDKPKLAPVDVTALEAELAEVETQSAAAAASPVVIPEAPAQVSAELQETPVTSDAQQSEPSPIVSEDAQAAPAQPAAETEKSVEAAAPAEEPAQASTSAPVAISQDAGSPAAVIPVYSTTSAEGDYAVQKGDNLWLIAMKYRQKSECNSQEHACNGVTVQQTMLTMQRLNPDAFMQGNINLLKKGKVLRMPTYDDLTEMTSREAFAEVRRQNVAWSGDANGRKNAAAVEQIDATHQDVAAVEAPVDVEEGRLKLSMPGSAESSAVGKASGVAAGSTEALQNELSISMEELDRNKREKGVVTDQLASLNEQANTMKQMLDVRSAELAAMQAALAKKQQAPVETPVNVEAAPDAQTEEPTPTAEQPVVTEEAPVAAPVTPVVEPVVETTSESPGILAQLQNNIVWLIGGVLTLVLIVFAVIKLRKRKPTASLTLQDDEMDMDASVTDALDNEEFNQEDADDSLKDSFEMDEDLFEEAPADAKPETSDAIGEADIYISFGTYEKAESLLKSAIASEPKRTDLRLKLLEVYVGMENLKAFDKQCTELNNLHDAGASERAREMRNRIAGASSENAMSSAPTALSPAVSVDDSLDFDLDMSEDKPTNDSDLDLDFDLDLDLGEEKEDSTMKSAKISMSDAPTVQQRALDISEMQTAVSPAIKAAEANTAMRESIDLDLSDLDAELKEFDAIPDAPAPKPAPKPVSKSAYDAIANDAPTPKTDLDEEFDFLADADEAATKLDLARAYIDMGDKEGAKDILEEVIEEGQEAQKSEARKLLAGIS